VPVLDPRAAAGYFCVELAAATVAASRGGPAGAGGALIPRATEHTDVLAVWQRALAGPPPDAARRRRAEQLGYRGYQPGAAVRPRGLVRADFQEAIQNEHSKRGDSAAPQVVEYGGRLDAHATLAGKPKDRSKEKEAEAASAAPWLVSYRRSTLVELQPPAVVELASDVVVCRPPSNKAAAEAGRAVATLAVRCRQPPPWLRADGAAWPIEVEWTTMDGTALAGQHYRPPKGSGAARRGRARVELTRAAPTASCAVAVTLLWTPRAVSARLLTRLLAHRMWSGQE
jgi:hypothetical protein